VGQRNERRGRSSGSDSTKLPGWRGPTPERSFLYQTCAMLGLVIGLLFIAGILDALFMLALALIPNLSNILGWCAATFFVVGSLVLVPQVLGGIVGCVVVASPFFGLFSWIGWLGATLEPEWRSVVSTIIVCIFGVLGFAIGVSAVEAATLDK